MKAAEFPICEKAKINAENLCPRNATQCTCLSRYHNVKYFNVLTCINLLYWLRLDVGAEGRRGNSLLIRGLHRPMEEMSMSTDKSTNAGSRKGSLLSLDAWAVIVALALALAVRFDILKDVPW
jgi:hypothetical protein